MSEPKHAMARATDGANGASTGVANDSHSARPAGSDTAERKITDVAVGVLVGRDGRVLLGQRPEGKPWSGWWELPGGKLEPGETVLEALARELHEELGINVTAATPWVTYVHTYPTTTVRLAFCRVTGWTGEPRGLENQDLQWVHAADAPTLGDVLPATYPPLRWLRLPDTYAITAIGGADRVNAYLERLDRALAGGLKLLQWREPQWDDGADSASCLAALERVVARCHAVGARVLINSVHPQAWWARADGVHLRAQDALAMTARPALSDDAWLAVSAHSAAEIAQARTLEADFAVLSPVLPTASHPRDPGCGWTGFAAMLADAGIPVFALGGQSAETLAIAQSYGAHGVAGIRGFI